MATLLSEDPEADQQPDFLLCLQCRSGDLSEAASRLRLLASALLDDILMSKLQVRSDLYAHDTVQIRLACPAAKALSATRSLQVAFEGFSGAAAGAPCISVVLAGMDETVDPGKLLASAKPFQVLVTQSFYAESEALQIYKAQDVPGVYEFLWTDDRRLHDLQAKHTLRLEAVPSTSRPSNPVTGFNDRTLLYTGQDSVVEPILSRGPSREPGEIREAGESEDQSRRGNGAARIAAVLGCVFALLGIVRFLGLTNTDPGRHLKDQVAVYLGWAPPAAPAKVPTISPPMEAPPTFASDSGFAANPPNTRPGPAPSLPKPAVTSTPHRPCTIDRSKIKDHLDLANGYMSQHGYRDAIRKYSQVLDCERGNATAKAGLLRALQALRDNPE
jgi:hypothetical protein